MKIAYDNDPSVRREVRFGSYMLNVSNQAAAWAPDRSVNGWQTQIPHPTWLRADALATVWSFQEYAQP